MAAWDDDVILDDFFNIVVDVEWISDTNGTRGKGDFDSFGIVLIENDVIFVGLVFGDVGLGGEIVGVIGVNV